MWNVALWVSVFLDHTNGMKYFWSLSSWCHVITPEVNVNSSPTGHWNMHLYFQYLSNVWKRLTKMCLTILKVFCSEVVCFIVGHCFLHCRQFKCAISVSFSQNMYLKYFWNGWLKSTNKENTGKKALNRFLQDSLEWSMIKCQNCNNFANFCQRVATLKVVKYKSFDLF